MKEEQETNKFQTPKQWRLFGSIYLRLASGESLPTPVCVVSHPAYRNLSATEMLGKQEMCHQRKTVIMEMVIQSRADLQKQATTERMSDMILFSFLDDLVCCVLYLMSWNPSHFNNKILL